MHVSTTLQQAGRGGDKLLLQGKRWAATARTPCTAVLDVPCGRLARRLVVVNSAATEVLETVAEKRAKSAALPALTMMVVQGSSLGDSLTVVNEVQVPRPKMGTLKRALKEKIPHVRAVEALVLPRQEAHGCSTATMAVAPTSMGAMLAYSGGPVPLAVVPNHRHYTLTHAHQLSTKPTHPRQPAYGTHQAAHHSPAPSVQRGHPSTPNLTVSLPTHMQANPISAAAAASMNTSTTHSAHGAVLFPRHEDLDVIACSTQPPQPVGPTSLHRPALQLPTPASSAATHDTTAAPEPSIAPASTSAAASEECTTGAQDQALATVDAAERSQIVNAVVAIVMRSTQAAASEAGVAEGSREHEQRLLALLQRQRPCDLAILWRRLQSVSATLEAPGGSVEASWAADLSGALA